MPDDTDEAAGTDIDCEESFYEPVVSSVVLNSL